jgi:hypothetical protein
MISYTWDILSLHTAPHENELDDVVKKVNWRFQATDGQYYGDITGTTELTVPTPETYVIFKNITEPIVVYWIKQNINYDDLVNQANQKLEDNKNPVIVEKTPPWERDGVVPGNNEYMVVIDDQPNDLLKIWGPLRWDSGRINKGLQIRGFEGLFVPENLTMVRKNLLPNEKPIVLNERVKIYKVEYPTLRFNQLLQKSSKIVWDISSGKAIGTFELGNRNIDEVKTVLKEIVNEITTEKLHTPSQFTINENAVKVYTDTQTYLVTSTRASQMNDIERVSWKLVDTWILASKFDLLEIANFIKQKVQEAYDFEFTLAQEIENAESIEQLTEIYNSIKGQ